MAKEKRSKYKFQVYYRNVWSYDSGETTYGKWYFLGNTIATSEEKAISNVRFRNNVHHYANQYHEYAGDGMRYIDFKAIQKFIL